MVICKEFVKYGNVEDKDLEARKEVSLELRAILGTQNQP